MDDTIETALAGNAGIKLVNASVTVTQRSDATWELDKVGSLSGNTVTWHITATKTATVSGQLVLQGKLTVTNDGSGPATIGNIVVNLQKRVGNNWVSASANVADATQGDAAITALIHQQASSEGKTSFTENSASGSLQFMDASNNSIFSLVPQVLIGPGETHTWFYQASFDNNVLGLAVGTPIRAEIIVTFGNSAQGNSTANLDINGNGTIDPDEARVRSVPTRLGVNVPAQVAGNSTVTLSDTLADIATTGTVTFSNAQFNLGATSGTVTVTVDGGTDGGSITNCAHLEGTSQTAGSGGHTFPIVNGVDLTACSTIDIGGTPSCTPGAPGCGWTTGDVITYDQVDYGASPSTNSGAATLATHFNAVFAGLFQIGVAGSSGFSMVFTTATDLSLYLPASGTPATLNADLLNPTTSSSGSFGGEVAALQLNVAFSDANVLVGSANLRFGDLRVCGLTAAELAGLNNRTVREILQIANAELGTGSTAFSPASLDAALTDLNESFRGGAVSAFAQNHLLNASSCP